MDLCVELLVALAKHTQRQAVGRKGQTGRLAEFPPEISKLLTTLGERPHLLAARPTLETFIEEGLR
jgi:hypothetical protein